MQIWAVCVDDLRSLSNLSEATKGRNDRTCKSAKNDSVIGQGINATEPAEDQEGENMASNQPVTAETLKQFLEAFNRHDLDAIMEFFAEGCSMDLPRGPHPWGRRFTGRAQIREGCAGRFKGLPDAHYGDDRHWVCGNMGFSEWTLTGTTPLGERVEVRGTDHLEFRDGKIIRKDSYWKMVGE
jgi:ketosteroid isomerase-like protein